MQDVTESYRNFEILTRVSKVARSAFSYSSGAGYVGGYLLLRLLHCFKL